MGDVQARAGLGDELIAEVDDLREVVSGIDVDEFEGHGGRRKGAAGELEDDDGVLAAGKEQAYLVELPGDFAQDVEGFVL